MAFARMDELPPEEIQQPTSGSSLMPRGLTMLLGLMAVFLAAQGIKPINSTVAAAFMALNVVIVVFPIQRFLARYIPRFLASVSAGIVAIGVLGGMIWSMGWTITRLVAELPKYSEQFNAMISKIVAWANIVAERYGAEYDLILQGILDQIKSLSLSTIISPLTGIAQGVSSFVGILLMIGMVLIFMIIDSVGFSERMLRLGERHNPVLAWGLSSFAKGTRKYWTVTTVFGLFVAICNFILLMVLNVPMAGVWALFSFVTNYIPNVGFIIGLVPPVIMALLAADPLTALWVVVGYCVFNIVIQTFIQPKVSGDAVGITPTIAILSLLFWAYVLGPLGAILAIPATLLVKTLFIDIDPRNRWLNVLIASNPRTSDQDPIRLSKILARTKRIRKLTAKVHSPGVTAEEAEAAQREIDSLSEEEPKPSDESGKSK
ncbi:MAG: AI-2E family transporter [Propionibacteriaceae bacterium]|jgi:predicted PurR-regulated permease PerM|nr:AI-2E family transporter [Propionibacteriaceae bacterium]